MRIVLAGVTAMILAATPALAVGVEDLANVVLGGQSVLKKADDTCPRSKFSLTRSDRLALTFARSAAEQALPISQFQALDMSAGASAEADAQKPTFCAETKRKKSQVLSKIKKAGRAMIASRALGM